MPEQLTERQVESLRRCPAKLRSFAAQSERFDSAMPALVFGVRAAVRRAWKLATGRARPSTEMQDDLREWADTIDQALAEHDAKEGG